MLSSRQMAKYVGLTETEARIICKKHDVPFKEDVDPEVYVEEHGLKTVNDEGALEEVLKKVIADNPQAVEDYRGGKEKALGALVGQTMKAMKGKADPGIVNQRLREIIRSKDV